MKYENIDWARAQMNLEKQQRELVEVYKKTKPPEPSCD
jgi:hypothetical protein|tara:strand:+ start:6485 stop:6598 length:114 start_codon:yes stop_codon:yes gene_type:complete